MLTLEEAKKAVVEDFSMYDEWLDKYEYLIELGKNLECAFERVEARERRAALFAPERQILRLLPFRARGLRGKRNCTRRKHRN